MEKKKADLAEALFCSPGERSPAPPISMLGGPPPKFVPERTKVWRNGTCLTGNANIEIGGRGQRPFPTPPEDLSQVAEDIRSMRFSKFVLLPNGLPLFFQKIGTAPAPVGR